MISLLLRNSCRIVTARNAYKLSSILNIPQATLPICSKRLIARWVAPTLKEIAARKKKFKIPESYKQRSGFIEWNLPAELYAFGKRLNENFKPDLLQQAFTQRSYIIQEELRQQVVGIEEPELNIKDNLELADRGDEILRKYVEAFIKYHLPNYPSEGVAAIKDYLLSTERLAHVSQNLGTKDIILTSEYPPSDETLATTLRALVGALANSQENGNLDRAYNFVRDFVCTQLNQLDVNELWQIENPFELLKKVCAEKNIPQIEPRIIGEVGKNTLLASFRIAIYDVESKKLLGTGFGDSYDNGTDIAAIDALSKLFGSYNLKPFNFQISVDECLRGENVKQSKNRLTA